MAFMLQDEFIVEPRGTLEMKGIGDVTTYFLLGKKKNKTTDVLFPFMASRTYPINI